MNVDSKHIQQQKITIDIQLLNQKQRILMNYYQLTQDQQIINLILSWPSPISQILKQNRIINRTNNAKYFGNTSNQLFHGYGLLIYDNTEGRFYQGNFQNNCKHGNGLQFIRGDIYIGKFVNNKPQDTNGVFMWKNGDIFHGVFINGMKHGMGKWESGTDYYDGLWKFNKPQGQGKIHTKTSDYQGQVKNGYKHGRGIQIFNNNDKYQGLYANGKPQGDGTYSWNNGAIYKGQFKNGIRYGYGQWSYGKQKYEGQYINDKRNGQGVYKWDGGSFYKGQFLEDMRHGIGQMHWSQGAFYRGQWKEGIQNGKGQLWQNGKLVSKGMFEQGKFINSKTVSIPKYIDKPSRYPIIQNKTKVRSSLQSNLHQIQETPKTNSKKNPASTSFSNHTRISRKSDNTYGVQKKLQPQRKIYFQKNKQKLSDSSQTGYHSVIKKQTKSKLSSKPIIDMTQTQLGPIKWKNFRHMKSPNNYGNLPQI